MATIKLIKNVIKLQKGGPYPSSNFNKRSWESEEEYKERLSNLTEQERTKKQQLAKHTRVSNKINRRAYLASEEGQKVLARLKQEDEALFKNAKVPKQKGLGRQAALTQTTNTNIHNTQQALAKNIQAAIDNKEVERQDKATQYKNFLRSLMTTAELGLSGASLLRAYGNWKNWANATNVTKRGIINLLNKNQIPLQAGGTVIDGIQTYDDISNGNTAGAIWNGLSIGLGLAGTIGATDVFRNSKYFNPKLDTFLDGAGLVQNAGDIGKFAWDTGYNYFNNKDR